MGAFQKIISMSMVVACLSISSTLFAQDPGEADTVRIGTVSGDVYNNLSAPVTLYNDEELLSIVIPVVIHGYSGWMRFDSLSYAGSRLEDISILPERESLVYATDTFTFEAFVIRFSVSSGDPLPAGDGRLCDVWFSPLFGGEILLDSMAVSPYGNLRLSDATMTDFLPEFQSGLAEIACDYEIGDTRQDGGVNVSDWMGFWKQYYGCQEELSPHYIADVNCDRRVDMRDLKAIFDHIWYNGDICSCGSYSQSLYNDPGTPDTLRIESDTLYVGVMDTIDIRFIYDEPLSGFWSVGLGWDGSAIMNLDDSYGWGYLCIDRTGNPGYVCPYSYGPEIMYSRGDSIIAQLPFIPLTTGTATIMLRAMPTGPESMFVTESNEAVIPVVVGGNITVLPRPCGDANADGGVNVADAVYILNYVFKNGPPPDPLDAGDANCDGQVNVADAVYLINFVFKEGPEPCCP